MNCEKSGNLICLLRQEKNMTQKQLADKMNISDKTISKWERGLGCPDVSLLGELSNILEVNIEEILKGDLIPNSFVAGNMKKSKYYVCTACGNVTVCTGNANVYCCGRKLEALKLKKADEGEKLIVDAVEDEWYITCNHVMGKDNYISFVGFVTDNNIQIIKCYPEWNMQVRIPKREQGMIIWYDTVKGLYYQNI